MKSIKVILGLSLLLSACGAHQGATPEEPTEEVTTNINPADLKPDVHLNVTPPPTESKSLLTGEMVEKFFQVKETYEGFSAPLKTRIAATYHSQLSSVINKQRNQNNSPIVFNTIFGRTAPVMYAMSGELADGGCDPRSGSPGLICLDSPQDGLETVEAGVDVSGHIDLSKLAVFGTNDPVAVVSIYNNTGGAMSEVPIMAGDIKDTSDPDVGAFSVAIGLSGSGKFTIIVSAYKVTDTGNNDLVSLGVNVTRVQAPEIEFVEARPDPENRFASDEHKNDPISDGEVISAENLLVKVRLTTAPGGVKTVFANYGEQNLDGETKEVLISATSAGPNDAGEITGKVRLHAGLNKIVISSSSPALENLLGPSAPPPSVLYFSVKNAGGAPVLKMLSPEKDGIIDQTKLDQKIELKFCFTFLPSQYTNASSNPQISQDCISGAPGFTPTVTLNGRDIVENNEEGSENPLGTLDFDASTGIFTATITPKFGVNFYEISAADTNTQMTTRHVGSFLFGKAVPMIKDGVLSSFDTFSPRGLNLHIDESLIAGDVKDMVIKFLQRKETVDLLLDSFKSVANKPGYVCADEYKDPNTGTPAQSNGDTSIEFHKDSFKLGEIELTDIEPAADGTFHLGLIIHGMHGDADLRAAESNGNTFMGMDLGFLPLRFSIGEMKIKLAVAFPTVKDIDLNKDGIMEPRSVLDIRKYSDDFLIISGDGPLGRPVYIDSTRNPLAAGIELLDWQQGLLLNQFTSIMAGTLLCGLEKGLNNESFGALGKATADLEKLSGYDKNNFLRFSLKSSSLGILGALLPNEAQFDAALNLLKGDIKFDTQGIHILNVPIRVNPSPDMLTELLPQFQNGIMGMVSRFKTNTEKLPQGNLTNDNKRIGIQLSEDLINMALAGVVQSGLLDLDLDANAYTKAGFVLSDRFLPLGSMFLAKNIDVNQNGTPEDDVNSPVMLRIRIDKAVPPMLTFLSEEEVARLAAAEQEANQGGSGQSSGDAPEETPGAGPVNKSQIDPTKKYFQLSLSGLEISLYRQEPKPSAGYRQYCSVALPTDQSHALEDLGFCGVPHKENGGATLVPVENLKDTVCDSASLINVPNANGEVISATPSSGDPTPLYRVRAGLSIVGTIQPVHREIPVADRVKLANPVEKNILRIKIVDSTVPGALLTSASVVENNTQLFDEEIVTTVKSFVSAVFATHCSNFNEIKIPLPEKFPADPLPGAQPTDPLLPDFNVDSIDLGGADTNRVPQAFIDDSRLYIDVLAYAGLNFISEEQTNESASGTGN